LPVPAIDPVDGGKRAIRLRAILIGSGMSAYPSPNKWGLVFHHLGLAVKDPEAAAHFLTGLGYRIGPVILDPLQNVHLAMCAHDQMPDVEIISPAEGAGPLDKLLSTHKDGLVYHMCYTCADLDRSLDALESDDRFSVRSIAPPTEAILFGGKRVSFYLVEGVGLIEIIDQAP
jgi:catechol 2,3-dioxygenase-like lactoylglutathione lyase family enzyme